MRCSPFNEQSMLALMALEKSSLLLMLWAWLSCLKGLLSALGYASLNLTLLSSHLATLASHPLSQSPAYLLAFISTLIASAASFCQRPHPEWSTQNWGPSVKSDHWSRLGWQDCWELCLLDAWFWQKTIDCSHTYTVDQSLAFPKPMEEPLSPSVVYQHLLRKKM